MLACASAVPFVFPERYLITQMTVFFIWATVVTQWNLVLGVGGIFSLAQMALFACGSYGTAMLGDLLPLAALARHAGLGRAGAHRLDADRARLPAT